MRRACLTSIATLAALCALTAAGAVQASSATVAWSTYLRAGPGPGFSAIDELEHNTTVDLRGCAGGWCRIVDGRTAGYVDKDALTLPRPPAAAPAGTQTCFTSAQAGYRGAAATRFCIAAPPVDMGAKAGPGGGRG